VSLREQWNEQARERQREISARKTETVALLQEANQERVLVAQQQKALAIELKNQLAQFHEQLETLVGN
nr:17 kda gas vesicle GvpC homolog {N-terminal} [Dactylococcopsis salina, Peptide Partial, 67 aa] [Dactylococcopsis salina]